MKTNKIHIVIIVATFLVPFFLKAQWKAVRFDQVNTFQKIVAASANTAFVTGIDPFSNVYFMLRTNDGGATWDSIGVNTVADTFQLAELYFHDINNGLVGGTKNRKQVLLKTNDNGNTWTDVTPEPSSGNAIVSVSFVDAQNGFATDGSTLYKTTNGGMTWTSKTLTITISDLNFSSMNEGILSGSSAFGGAVVLKTTDGGQSWNPLLTVYDTNLFVNSFAKLNVVNPHVMFTAQEYSNKLFRTLDGGNSWDTITVIDTIWGIHDFDFVSADTGHLLSNMGQIFGTVDGGKNWHLEYATEWKFYGPSVNLNSFSFIDQTGFVAGSNGLIKKYTASSVTGVEGMEFNESVSIYPNPFSDFATVHISNIAELKNANLSLAFYDIFGRKVLQSEIHSPQFQIHKGDLSNGVYFYEISDEKKEIIVAGKIVIQ